MGAARGLRRAAWAIAGRTRWRWDLYHLVRRYSYNYSFTPAQLAVMVQALDAARAAEGCVLEVGCANGSTTMFLKTHLAARNDARRYVCIDTFSGFTPEDMAVENLARGKTVDYSKHFEDVSRKVFERNLAANGIVGVEAIQADVSDFDFDRVTPIAFALIDVDLYRPTKRALAEVYDRLSPGGVMVCDDCDPSHPAYDGAFQAYMEVVAERGLGPEIVEAKLGVLRVEA